MYAEIGEVTSTGPMHAHVDGFDLHAAVSVPAGDRKRLEHLTIRRPGTKPALEEICASSARLPGRLHPRHFGEELPQGGAHRRALPDDAAGRGQRIKEDLAILLAHHTAVE